MHYLLMLFEDEASQPEWDSAEGTARVERYLNATRAFKGNGEFVAGDALQPSSTATTVRVRDDALLVTDGPFAETREQLIGYYLLDCDDLDAAIEAARRIPAIEAGAIEIRPIKIYNAE